WRFLYCFSVWGLRLPLVLPSFPTRRSSDLQLRLLEGDGALAGLRNVIEHLVVERGGRGGGAECQEHLLPAGADRHQVERLLVDRSEEHTSELQSRENLVCRLLLEKKTQKPA